MRGVFALVSETLAQDPAYRSVHPRMPAFRVQLAGIAGHGGRFVVGADAGPGMIRFPGRGHRHPGRCRLRRYCRGGDVIEVHSHVHLDDREFFTSVERQSVASQRRTGHAGVDRRTR
jgi:hypothetical protein